MKKTDEEIRAEAFNVYKFVKDWLFDSEMFRQTRVSVDQSWTTEQIKDVTKMIISAQDSYQSSMEAEKAEAVRQYRKQIINEFKLTMKVSLAERKIDDGQQVVFDKIIELLSCDDIIELNDNQSSASEIERRANEKVEEYKKELFADFKRRNLYNPTLAFLEFVIFGKPKEK